SLLDLGTHLKNSFIKEEMGSPQVLQSSSAPNPDFSFVVPRYVSGKDQDSRSKSPCNPKRPIFEMGFRFWILDSSAFTLIELLVAIALFSTLVAIATGGFVNALRSERQASAMMAAESNVDIALEEMAREMRTSYLFCRNPANASGIS